MKGSKSKNFLLTDSENFIAEAILSTHHTELLLSTKGMKP